MYCKKCGKVIPDNSTFCASCGSGLEDVPVKSNQTVNDFFAFKTMIGHTFIKVIYILGMIGITIGSIIFMVMGSVGSVYIFGLGWISVLSGLGMLIFGNLFWRIACEIWILFFSMHNMLGNIEENFKK